MLQWRNTVPARSASLKVALVRVQCSKSVRRMEDAVASAPSRLVLMMWASSNRALRKGTPLRFRCVCMDPILQPRRSVSDSTRALGRVRGVPSSSVRRV